MLPYKIKKEPPVEFQSLANLKTRSIAVCEVGGYIDWAWPFEVLAVVYGMVE